MNNALLVRLSQDIPGVCERFLGALKRLRHRAAPSRIPLIEGIDHFPSPQPKTRHALLTLSPEAWLLALSEAPDIRLFNFYGLTYEIVRSLNLNGYVVDIADMTREHVPSKPYDILIGHGGHCRTLIEHLPKDSLIFQYVSGAHWKAFNEESQVRYARFARSRGVAQPPRFGRDLSGVLAGEEFLFQHADCLFTIHCPRMIGTFGPSEDRFFFTGLGAYPDSKLTVPPYEKNFTAGRRNFIYVGGTGGNIQKGMDLLIEAFAATPEANLFIYCRIEDNILRAYDRELKLPNIRYIFHLRAPILNRRLKDLIRTINYTIHAPINTGIGTAFMASMGVGLIPVGYVDLEESPAYTILSDDWSVDSLKKTLHVAMDKDPDWCRTASSLAKDFHERNCGGHGIRERFEKLFSASHLCEIRQRRVNREKSSECV